MSYVSALSGYNDVPPTNALEAQLRADYGVLRDAISAASIAPPDYTATILGQFDAMIADRMHLGLESSLVELSSGFASSDSADVRAAGAKLVPLLQKCLEDVRAIQTADTASASARAVAFSEELASGGSLRFWGVAAGLVLLAAGVGYVVVRKRRKA